jgi:transposase InsO family protein
LTFQDELSKYTLAIPIQQDAETVARAFVEQVIPKFGIPQVILTDQGSNFLGEFFTNVCKLLKIKKIHRTAYHPEKMEHWNGHIRYQSNTYDVSF